MDHQPITLRPELLGQPMTYLRQFREADAGLEQFEVPADVFVRDLVETPLLVRRLAIAA